MATSPLPVGFPTPSYPHRRPHFPGSGVGAEWGRAGETTPERRTRASAQLVVRSFPQNRQLAGAAAQNPGRPVLLCQGASFKSMITSRVLSVTVVSRPVLVSLATRCCTPAAIPSRFLSSTALRAASTRDGSLVAARTEASQVGLGRLRPASQRRNFLTMPAQEKGQAAGAAGEKKAKKPPPALRPSSR